MNPETRPSGYLQLFKTKDFSMLWLASVAMAASIMAVEATVTWGTWESTGSATAVGILISAISLPRIILETLVGRVVDAFDRKKLMILAALGASLVSLALTLLTRESNGSTLFATVSFTWMLTVFNMLFHRARSSLLPRLISEHSILVSAQALLHITVSGMSVLSGGAALLIPVIGRVSIMAAGAAMAIAAALAAGQISHSDQGRSGVKAIRPSFGFRNLLGDPLDIVKSNRFLAWFIVFVALTNIPHRAMLAMVLPISAEKTGLGAQGYGAIQIALSIGVIAGCLVAGRLLSRGNPVLWVILGIGFSALFAGLIALLSGTLTIVALFVAYGLVEGFFIPGFAKFDLEIPDDLRGRVNSLFNIAGLLLSPVAQIGGGMVSDRFGPSTLYGWSGLALFVVALVAVALRPPEHLEEETQGAVESGNWCT